MKRCGAIPHPTPAFFPPLPGRKSSHRAGYLLIHHEAIGFSKFSWVLFPHFFAFAQPDTDHAYLGVHTSRLDQGGQSSARFAWRVHLQVEQVAPGSPAENAGLKLYDVLLKFDDQLLINPEQLKTLVQMRNPGERVSLSIFAQSKPVTLSVELIEARGIERILMIVNGWMMVIL